MCWFQQFVREALEKLAQDVEPLDLEDDPLSEMVGVFRGGPPYDVIVKHDEVICLDQQEN